MQSAINKKNTIDITSNIMIEVIDNKLILKATDHEIYIKATLIPNIIEGKICCAVNGDSLSSIMKSLNDSEIIIEENEGILSIKQNKSCFNLPIFEINDFPFRQNYQEMEKVNIDNTLLLHSIKRIIHCCSDKEMLNIAMQGILIEAKEKSISIVATDSKRMGYIQKQTENTKSFSCIIPKKAINEIFKLFDNDFEFYIKRIDEEQIETIAIINSEFEFYAKIINAKFPNYENLIASKPKVKAIVIEKEKFIKALNQVSSICSRIKVTFMPNEIIFETLEGINGASGSSSIDNIVTHIAEPKITGLVNKHILDCITSTKYEEIELYIDDPNKPIFVTAKDFEEIIMPQII